MIGIMPVKLDYALAEKKALVKALYQVLEEEAQKFPFVCKPGCAVCCTVNIVATGAEARYFLDTLAPAQKESLYQKLKPLEGARRIRPKVTPNEMAALYMAGKEPPPDEGFVYEPCIFLDENKNCLIYLYRPFICRTVYSLKTCTVDSEALMPPEFLSLSTVFIQLLEEIDFAGLYGSFYDLLLFFLERERAGETEDLSIPEELLANREVPDFAIPPEHEKYVRSVLSRLYRQKIDHKTFKDLLDEIKEGAQVKEALSFLGDALG